MINKCAELHYAPHVGYSQMMTLLGYTLLILYVSVVEMRRSSDDKVLVCEWVDSRNSALSVETTYVYNTTLRRTCAEDLAYGNAMDSCFVDGSIHHKGSDCICERVGHIVQMVFVVNVSAVRNICSSSGYSENARKFKTPPTFVSMLRNSWNVLWVSCGTRLFNRYVIAVNITRNGKRVMTESCIKKNLHTRTLELYSPFDTDAYKCTVTYSIFGMKMGSERSIMLNHPYVDITAVHDERTFICTYTGDCTGSVYWTIGTCSYNRQLERCSSVYNELLYYNATSGSDTAHRNTTHGEESVTAVQAATNICNITWTLSIKNTFPGLFSCVIIQKNNTHTRDITILDTIYTYGDSRSSYVSCNTKRDGIGTRMILSSDYVPITITTNNNITFQRRSRRYECTVLREGCMFGTSVQVNKGFIGAAVLGAQPVMLYGNSGYVALYGSENMHIGCLYLIICIMMILVVIYAKDLY